MTLPQILVFATLALWVGRWTPARPWLLLAISVLAIYWTQPALPIRGLDFWLPTATLAVTIWVWGIARPERKEPPATGEADAAPRAPHLPARVLEFLRRGDQDGRAALLIAALILGLGATRYLGPLCCVTPSRPPEFWQIAVGVGGAALLAFVLRRFAAGRRGALEGAVWALLAVFILLKTDPLAQAAALGLRALTGQSQAMASALDIRWLGFSYVAFRLIHTLRDRLAGRLPDLSLAGFVTYIIFFPAFTAGPIDRVQRFSKEFAGKPDWSGFERILWGVFKKFALADTLALVALNGVNASQVIHPGWLWVLVYAYALRIYFDFSGYTDIAIGLGRLMGFHLPENFERPYLKPNLTTFWNAWHITLAQWFRAYWFNPLTRALRTGRWQPPLSVVILLGQLSTMLLIGLWHGVTWNFALWGLWHGVGLFVHNRWSEATKARFASLNDHPAAQRFLAVVGALATFHYVALGWVWFALPSAALSWQTLLKLFGG